MKAKVYLEVTSRRTFACAVDWPGWCRAGKTEDEALANLVAYGERYLKSLGKHAAKLKPPVDASDLEVVERLKGNATTEFGAPASFSSVSRS